MTTSFRVLMKMDGPREQWEEEWLKHRLTGIGASEIAGILLKPDGSSFSPWDTPLSVYVNKIEGVSKEDSLQMELGRELEPFLRRKFNEWLLEKEGIEVAPMENMMLQHLHHDIVICTPDFLFMHPHKGIGGCEFKTASEYAKAEWGNDEVPEQYYLQTQYCMAVTGAQYWYLAYLLGNRKFEVLYITRNETIVNTMIGAADSYWINHIIPRIPPAPTGAAVDSTALKSIYSRHVPEKTVELPDLEKAYSEIFRLQAEGKKIEAQIELNKQIIQAKMGDAEVALFGLKDNGKMKKATWKKTADSYIEAHTRKGGRPFRVW